jgi:hypothetical protein
MDLQFHMKVARKQAACSVCSRRSRLGGMRSLVLQTIQTASLLFLSCTSRGVRREGRTELRRLMILRPGNKSKLRSLFAPRNLERVDLMTVKPARTVYVENKRCNFCTCTVLYCKFLEICNKDKPKFSKEQHYFDWKYRYVLTSASVKGALMGLEQSLGATLSILKRGVAKAQNAQNGRRLFCNKRLQTCSN